MARKPRMRMFRVMVEVWAGNEFGMSDVFDAVDAAVSAIDADVRAVAVDERRMDARVVALEEVN